MIAVLDQPDSRVRRPVVEHLAGFKRDEVAARALVSLLQAGDPSPVVEAEAAKSLGVMKAASGWETILAALERPSWNEIIRVRALEGLGATEDPRAPPDPARMVPLRAP